MPAPLKTATLGVAALTVPPAIGLGGGADASLIGTTTPMVGTEKDTAALAEATATTCGTASAGWSVSVFSFSTACDGTGAGGGGSKSTGTGSSGSGGRTAGRMGRVKRPTRPTERHNAAMPAVKAIGWFGSGAEVATHRRVNSDAPAARSASAVRSFAIQPLN